MDPNGDRCKEVEVLFRAALFVLTCAQVISDAIGQLVSMTSDTVALELLQGAVTSATQHVAPQGGQRILENGFPGKGCGLGFSLCWPGLGPSPRALTRQGWVNFVPYFTICVQLAQLFNCLCASF